MSFFDDFPEPTARQRSTPPVQPEWSGPPSDELPGIVPVGDMVARGSNAVVALKLVEVFSTGCLFDMVWSVRRSDESEQEWRAVMERTFQRPGLPGLMIGAALPDGRKVFTARSPFGDPDAVTGPILMHRGGGGGSAGDEQAEGSVKYWLWPLPAEGDLRLVAKWDELGLPEGSVVVPGELLARAREHVRGYWSE